MRSRRTVAALSLTTILLACGQPPERTAASAEPTAKAPVASAGPNASSSAASAQPKAAGPGYTVTASFSAGTRVFPLARHALACSDHCMTGTTTAAKVETTLVDRKEAKKLPLFPENEWRASYQNNPTIFGSPRGVEFRGSYPDKLVATLDAPYDRGGYGSVMPMALGPSGWQMAGEWPSGRSVCHLEASFSGYARGEQEGCRDAGLGSVARRLLPRLVESPSSVDRLVVTSKDDGVILLKDGYARYVGGAWQKKPAPWTSRPAQAFALEDGSFVVNVGKGLVRVGVDDVVAPVALREGEGESARILEGVDRVALLGIGDEIWVSFEHDGKTKLALPPADGSLRPFRPEPVAPPTPVEAKLPEAVKHTDACTTPYVLLASNNEARYVFSATVGVFFGHAELQKELVFLQIQRGAATTFGVQAKSLDAAKAAMDLAQKAKFKPQLACLDATGAIGDLTAPPDGVRVYWANLATKQLLYP